MFLSVFLPVGIVVAVIAWFGIQITEELQQIRGLLSLIQCEGVGKHPGQNLRA